VRVVTRDPARGFDAGLVAERVRAACAVRTLAAPRIDSDALRLLHGEGDRVPGLVLDRYATTGVIRFDGPAADAAWRPHVATIAAALGGARRVTTVDLARPAIAAARRNFERSGLTTAHDLHAADVFAFLAEARAAGRRWDLVVCDPPSFAPSEKAKPAALVA